MTAPTIPTHNTAVEAQFLAPQTNQGAGSKSKKQAAAEYLAAANDGFAGVEPKCADTACTRVRSMRPMSSAAGFARPVVQRRASRVRAVEISSRSAT